MKEGPNTSEKMRSGHLLLSKFNDQLSSRSMAGMR